jgi:ABC-type bacteriocin/lantibiotic exporter with double-glycine peptidase domain
VERIWSWRGSERCIASDLHALAYAVTGVFDGGRSDLVGNYEAKEVKYQLHKSTCGPASLANAFEALGYHRTEEELRELSKGKGGEGTTYAGMKKAVVACGLGCKTIVEQRERNAMLALYYAIDNNMPVIIPIRNWEHWVAVVGKLGNNYIVVDSGSDDLLYFYTAKEVSDLWRSPTGRYYGIVVHEPPGAS